MFRVVKLTKRIRLTNCSFAAGRMRVPIAGHVNHAYKRHESYLGPGNHSHAPYRTLLSNSMRRCGSSCLVHCVQGGSINL